jgi:hypothetical protein
VAVDLLVLLEEAVGDRRHVFLRDRAVGHCGPQLEALANIAAFGNALKSARALGDAVGVELAVGLFGQDGERVIDRCEVGITLLVDHRQKGMGVLVLQIGHQQSGGRGDARLDRRDHVLGVDRLGQRD